MGILYVVATPIGNLKDITLRALEALKGVDLILAEDTRVTRKLLNQYDIKKPLKRYDEHIAERVHGEVRDKLRKGERVALVSDAGTPGISDPGSRLVRFIQRELPDAKIVPIPGPSALIAALSVSGVSADKFTFLGYPPHKKGRQTFFKKLKTIEVRPVVFYESPHRLEKALMSLSEIFGEEYEIVVARELTKLHEEIFKGSVLKTQLHLQGKKKKGEFVMIIP